MIEKKNTPKKEILFFLFITIILSSGVFLWMFNGAKDNMASVLAMMYIPGISAMITAMRFRIRIATFGWKPGKIKYLLIAYILPALVALISYGLLWMSRYGDFSSEQVVNYKWAEALGFDLPAPFVAGLFSKVSLYSILALFFVFGEELGWSGFLTPTLRKIFSVPVTSLIVGVVWSVWHYPAIIGGFYGYEVPLWASLPGFTLVMIGASFIRTILVDRSESLWPGVLLHVSHNVILMELFLEMTVYNGDAYYYVSETGAFLGIIYILVSLAYWRFQRKPAG